MRGADLSDADLSGATSLPAQIVPEYGSFYGFKKLSWGFVALLYVPKSAARVGGLIGRKCRVSKALVKAIYNLRGEVMPPDFIGQSTREKNFNYEVGKWVKPKEAFSADIRVECAAGIHLFLTRKEAEDY
jgi:hypothetical protein